MDGNVVNRIIFGRVVGVLKETINCNPLLESTKDTQTVLRNGNVICPIRQIRLLFYVPRILQEQDLFFFIPQVSTCLI